MDHLPSRRVPKAPRQEQHCHDETWNAHGASDVVKGESSEYAGEAHEQRPDDQEPKSYSCAPRRLVYVAYPTATVRTARPRTKKVVVMSQP